MKGDALGAELLSEWGRNGKVALLEQCWPDLFSSSLVPIQLKSLDETLL